MVYSTTQKRTRSPFRLRDGKSVHDLVSELPKSIHVTVSDGELVIREDWFHWTNGIVLLGLTGLASQCLPKYQDWIWRFRTGEPLEQGLIAVAAIAFVVAAYWSLAGLVNTTSLIVRDGKLKRHIGPLPWYGDLSLNRSEIYQLFVIHKKRSKRRQSPWDWEGDTTTERTFGASLLRKQKLVSYYKLVVRLKDKKTDYTVSNEYRSVFVPRMLELILESGLEIGDAYVGDEVRHTR